VTQQVTKLCSCQRPLDCVWERTGVGLTWSSLARVVDQGVCLCVGGRWRCHGYKWRREGGTVMATVLICVCYGGGVRTWAGGSLFGVGSGVYLSFSCCRVVSPIPFPITYLHVCFFLFHPLNE
jgi:hypothetical protein